MTATTAVDYWFYEDTQSRFYASRVGMLLNQKRILCLNKDGLYALDGYYHDVVKETVKYQDMRRNSIVLGSENEVTVSVPGLTESYVIPYRAEFLSRLYEVLESVWGEEGVQFRVLMLNRRGELTPWNVNVRLRTLRRFDATSMVIVDEQSLHDAVELTLIADSPSDFIVHWRNGQPEYYSIKEGTREALTSLLLENMQTYLGHSIPTAEVSKADALKYLSSSYAAEATHLFSIVTLQKYHNRVSGTTFLCDLCLSESALLLKDNEFGHVLCGNSIQFVHAIILSENDAVTFTIEFTHGDVVKFSSASRDIVVANILETAERFNYSIMIKNQDTQAGLSFEPKYAAHRPETEDYFVRLIGMTQSQPLSLLASLRFFNVNMPLSGMMTKDKTLLPILGDIISGGGEGANTALVCEALGVLQRLMGSKFWFEEVSRGLAPLLPRVVQLATKDDPRLSFSAASTLLSFVKQTFPYKNAQLESVNKEAVFTNPTVKALVAYLRTYPSAAVSPLTLYVLLEVLDVAVFDRAESSSDAVLSKVLTSLVAVLPQLHVMCRSPALGIVRHASLVLRAVFSSAVRDPPLFRSLQDDARHIGALLTHVHTAVSTGHDVVRATAADMVALLVHDNNASSDLVMRVFPRRLVEERLLSSSSKGAARYVPSPKGSVWPPWPAGLPPPLTALSPSPLPWRIFFAATREDVLESNLIWDDRTRAELTNALAAEYRAFASAVELNEGRTFRWNHDEFEVRYECLREELPVGDYYLRRILSSGDAVVDNPKQFVEQIIYSVMFVTEAETRISCLRALIWCYSKYSSLLGTFNYVPPLVGIFLAAPERAVRDHVLLLLREIFILRRNIIAFVDAGGLQLLVRELVLVHTGHLPNSAASSITHTLTPCASVQDNALICLELFVVAVSLVPSVDEMGRVLVPLPRVKKELCRPVHLHHIIQVLVTQNPNLISITTHLLDLLVRHNDPILPSLYKTGLFYFLLMYTGNDVGAIAALLALTHDKQAFDPTTVGLPEPQRSILCSLLPDTLIRVLAASGGDAFGSALVADTDSPYLIWNARMRADVAAAIARHLAAFLDDLARNPLTDYTYVPMKALVFPNLEAELRCGPVYIRNFIDLERFPNTVVDEPVALMEEIVKRFTSRQLAAEHVLPLIHAQVILFQRFHRLPPFKTYAAFPTLVSLLTLQSRDSLALEAALPTLTAATELVHLAVRSSDDNVAGLQEAGGLPVLAALFSALVGARSGPTRLGAGREDAWALVLAHLLNVWGRMTSSERARVLLTSVPTVFMDTVVVAGGAMGRASSLIDAALGLITSLALVKGGQDFLFASGALFILLNWILKFDHRRSESEESEVVRTHATGAVRSLTALAGLCPESYGTLPHERTQRALAILLNGGLVKRLKNPNAAEFLVFVSADHETPVVMWNKDTRAELATFVRAKCLTVLETDGRTDFTQDGDVASFTYETLRREIRVGDVFVRLFNATPMWPLDDVSTFLGGLLTALAAAREAWDSLSEKDQGKDEVVSAKMEALAEAAVNVLAASAGIEAMLPTWSPFRLLFGMLSLRTKPSIVARVLSIIEKAAVPEGCVSAMAGADGLIHLVRLLKTLPSHHVVTLGTLRQLLKGSSVLEAEFLHVGGPVFVLEIFTDKDAKEDVQKAAARLLSTALADVSGGPWLATALATYMPAPFVTTLAAKPVEALKRFHTPCEEPTLVWNLTLRDEVRSHVQAEAAALTLSGRGAEASSALHAWVPEGKVAVVLRDCLTEVVVAGIYVRVYNGSHGFKVTEPVAFALGLLSAIRNTPRSDSATLCMCLTALTSCLKGAPLQIDEVGSALNAAKDDLEAFLGLLREAGSWSDDTVDHIRRALMGALSELVRSSPFISAAAAFPVIMPLYHLVIGSGDVLLPGLRCILRCVRHSDVMSRQAIEGELAPRLLELLGKNVIESVKSVAAGIIVVLLSSPQCPPELSAAVGASAVWAAFATAPVPDDVDDEYIKIDWSNSMEAVAGTGSASSSGPGPVVSEGATPQGSGGSGSGSGSGGASTGTATGQAESSSGSGGGQGALPSPPPPSSVGLPLPPPPSITSVADPSTAANLPLPPPPLSSTSSTGPSSSSPLPPPSAAAATTTTTTTTSVLPQPPPPPPLLHVEAVPLSPKGGSAAASSPRGPGPVTLLATGPPPNVTTPQGAKAFGGESGGLSQSGNTSGSTASSSSESQAASTGAPSITVTSPASTSPLPPPPPPPPPPMAPSPPALPSSSPSSSAPPAAKPAALLQDIQKGKALKKVAVDSDSGAENTSSGAARKGRPDDMFASIREGKSLKKTTTGDIKEEPRRASSGNALQDVLEGAMSKRRSHLERTSSTSAADEW